jgi:hypothetical protein
VPLEIAAVAAVGARPPLGVTAASSWLSSSAALCQRSAARFSRQRMSTPVSAGETAGRTLAIDSGTWVMCAASIACGVGALNGVRPASISYPMMPTA